MKLFNLVMVPMTTALFLTGCGKPTFSSQKVASEGPAPSSDQSLAAESKRPAKAPKLEAKKDLDCSGVILHGDHERCDIQDLEAEKTEVQAEAKNLPEVIPAPQSQSSTAKEVPAGPETKPTSQETAPALPPSPPATTSGPTPVETQPSAPAPAPQPTTGPAPAPAPAPAPTTPPKDPNIVEFKIKAGTGANPWNTAETMVTVKVGQTIRLVNEDTVNHRLHTGGAPCPHGTNFGPGQTFDCVATRALDPAATPGRTYDHIAGEDALFHLKVIP